MPFCLRTAPHLRFDVGMRSATATGACDCNIRLTCLLPLSHRMLTMTSSARSSGYQVDSNREYVRVMTGKHMQGQHRPKLLCADPRGSPTTTGSSGNTSLAKKTAISLSRHAGWCTLEICRSCELAFFVSRHLKRRGDFRLASGLRPAGEHQLSGLVGLTTQVEPFSKSRPAKSSSAPIPALHTLTSNDTYLRTRPFLFQTVIHALVAQRDSHASPTTKLVATTYDRIHMQHETALLHSCARLLFLSGRDGHVVTPRFYLVYLRADLEIGTTEQGRMRGNATIGSETQVIVSSWQATSTMSLPLPRFVVSTGD